MNEYLLQTMLFGFINKMNTGNILIDLLYIVGVILLFTLIGSPQFKGLLFRKFQSIVKYFDNARYLTIKSEDNNVTLRFRAILHHINRKENPTITSIIENMQMKWSKKSNDYEEDKNITWKINQTSEFIVTNNIKGKIYYYEKEKFKNTNDKMNMIEVTEMVLFSSTLSIHQLTVWVDDKLEEYEQFIKSKTLDKQYLVDITYNSAVKDIEYLYTMWSSNVKFDNRFFTDKNEIVNKINFFINNPKWYEERGIPHTLGILLWGEPGCGKTGFIKSIMNLTNRHGINIKLTNKFDMNLLRDLIYDEEIGKEMLIPQNKRIIIFEDIDCMSDITTDREIKEQHLESKLESNSIMKKNKDTYEEKEAHDLSNNSLSFLLNILDGLQECTGRIIIMTTNKPHLLDKALIRPGRIDYKINFTKATKQDIMNILNFYWSVDYDGYLFSNEVEQKYSHAEIINFCRSSNTLIESIGKII